MQEKQRAVCDGFTYIPQYSGGAMASINVACASAIVLHRFAVWAGLPESPRAAGKFVDPAAAAGAPAAAAAPPDGDPSALGATAGGGGGGGGGGGL